MANSEQFDDDMDAGLAVSDTHTQLVVQVSKAVHRRIKLQGFVEGTNMNRVVDKIFDDWMEKQEPIKIGDKTIS